MSAMILKRTAELRRAGMPAAEARAQAQRESEETLRPQIQAYAAAIDQCRECPEHRTSGVSIYCQRDLAAQPGACLGAVIDRLARRAAGREPPCPRQLERRESRVEGPEPAALASPHRSTTPPLHRSIIPSFQAAPVSGSRLRVGFLTPTLLFGGAERWVAMLAIGLDPERFHVAGVAVRDPGKQFPAIAADVTRRCPIDDAPGAFLRLAAASDVRIAWGLTDLSMLAGFLDRGGRVVMVGHGHCDWTVSAIRKCLPYVTDCAAVSRHATASFPDPSRVAVIHNGIDTDRCAAVRARQELRSAWGVQPGEIAVGYVGRLSAEKNPLAAVEAAKRLRDRDRESRGLKLTGIGSRRHRAVLVGGGPGTPWILKRARKILRDVIHVPPVENVGDIYRAMDCFVLASPSEGFSLALAEAWHCGCPTVSTPVGATELMEEYGPMGIQVPIGATPEQLAAAVLAAIAEPNRGIVEHAARVVTEHYTAAAMCRRWDEYLTGLRSTR